MLVQNLHNDLTPSLSLILGTVPRWRLIQTALPYVLHAAANLLHNRWVVTFLLLPCNSLHNRFHDNRFHSPLRKDFQTLGAMETTLLYILHWILLDSAEECSETDADPGNPFYYLFSIPTMSVCNFRERFRIRVNVPELFRHDVTIFLRIFAALRLPLCTTVQSPERHRF